MEADAHRWFLALAVLLGLLAPFAAPTRTAFACSCAVPPSLATQIETASVAFTGKVEAVEPGGSGALSEQLVRVEFEAKEFWKGQPAERMVVYTANNSASCGFFFEEGKEYFVLASGTQRLETNLCLFNVNLDDAADTDLEAIEALGDGLKPHGDDSPPQGNGGSNGPNGGDQPPAGGNGGSTADGTETSVDPDPLNVGVVVLSALAAAGLVVVVGRRK